MSNGISFASRSAWIIVGAILGGAFGLGSLFRGVFQRLDEIIAILETLQK